MIVTNTDRAEWAAVAIRSFMQETGLSEADGTDTSLTDLLCDLHHWADRHGLTWNEMITKAGHTYDEETGDLCHVCKVGFCLFDGAGEAGENGVLTCSACLGA